ncbi:MAG: hypothetical protein AAF736_13540 [Pseudomonadota bacterium]
MIRAYYLLTPLFMLLDWVLDLNLRVAGLADPGHRILYYGFLVGCTVLLWKVPQTSQLVALAESSVNFFLLIAGVMLPILGHAYLLDDPSYGFSGWPQLVNFLVTGTILTIVIRRTARGAPVR